MSEPTIGHVGYSPDYKSKPIVYGPPGSKPAIQMPEPTDAQLKAFDAKVENMIELKKRGKDGELTEEGFPLPEVLPVDPKRTVEELKGEVSARDQRIAELEALLKKVNDK